MEITLVVLIILMSIFLGIFILYLVYLLLKWSKLRKEDAAKNNLNGSPAQMAGPAAQKNGSEVIKVPTPKYRLEPGSSYYLFDKGSKEGYKLLKAYLARDFTATTVTHFNPEGLKKRLDPLRSDFIWLTRKKTEEESYTVLSPTNLGFVLQELEDRIQGPKDIIYIDCLERCYKDNGMERTDKFLKNLKKSMKKREAVLLMSIEPAGTNRKTREFLKNNLKELGRKKKKSN